MKKILEFLIKEIYCLFADNKLTIVGRFRNKDIYYYQKANFRYKFGKIERITLSDLKTKIDSGEKFYTSDDSGNFSEIFIISKNNRFYLKTKNDGIEGNNLGNI